MLQGQTHWVCLFSILQFPGYPPAHTFRNFKRSCIMLYAKPWEHPSTVSTLRIVILLSAGLNSSTRYTVASVAISTGRSGRALSVTFERPWENFSTQLWIALRDKHFPQEIFIYEYPLHWVLLPINKRTIGRCSSIVYFSSTVAIFTTETSFWTCVYVAATYTVLKLDCVAT
jgi:hypothetical protein